MQDSASADIRALFDRSIFVELSTRSGFKDLEELCTSICRLILPIIRRVQSCSQALTPDCEWSQWGGINNETEALGLWVHKSFLIPIEILGAMVRRSIV